MKTTKVTIEIEDTGIAINGKEINLPTTPSTLEWILGPFRRCDYRQAPPRYIWDTLGLVVQGGRKSDLYAFEITLNQERQKDELIEIQPTSTYKGELFVGGVSISGRTPIKTLAEKKRGTQLIKGDHSLWNAAICRGEFIEAAVNEKGFIERVSLCKLPKGRGIAGKLSKIFKQ